MALKGITWNHSRGFISIAAVAQRYNELTGEEVVWEKRSLQKFADAPIDKLAEDYDLLIIDHPWAGFAADKGALLPLNEYFAPEFFAELKKNSVGKSYDSYDFDGYYTALPIDAATPVAAYRPDQFAGRPMPETWEDVLALAREGKVIFSANPLNTVTDYYMFCAAVTDDWFTEDYMIGTEAGTEALERMRELAALCGERVFTLNPIQVYEALGGEDNLAYCPFVFGYSNYARRGYTRHLVGSCDLVRYNGKKLATILGGTGLGISHRCRDIDAAVRFLKFAVSEEVQRTIFTDNGGQPGYMTAWLDEENNRITHNFFRDTLPALDRAILRPRYSGYLDFQDTVGAVIYRYMKDGGNPAAAVAEINRLYLASKHKA